MQFPNIKISISACLLTPGNKNGILVYDPITILLFAMFFASELYMFTRDNPKMSLQYERYSSCVEGVITITHSTLLRRLLARKERAQLVFGGIVCCAFLSAKQILRWSCSLKETKLINCLDKHHP